MVWAGHARPLRAKGADRGVFGIVLPACGILIDVGPDAIEFILIANDAFPIVPLPDGDPDLPADC